MKHSSLTQFHRTLLAALAASFTAGSALAQQRDLFVPLVTVAAADAPMSSKRKKAVDAIEKRPTTKSVALFAVDVDALRDDGVRLALADQPPVVAARRSFDVDPRKPKDFVWTGELVEVPGDAIFVVHDGKIVGTIRNGGELYRIESVDDGVHAVIRVDESKFPQEEPASQYDRVNPAPAVQPMNDSARADAPARSTIDVLVAYTSRASKASGDIDALIQLAVAEANQSYSRSGIAMQLRLVETLPVKGYKEPADFDRIIRDFVGMKNVKARVNAAGVDVAVLIMNHSRFCGYANEIGATAATAFAVVHYDCATGYYSFAHEIGHLMGARHDIANDPAVHPFPWGHGFQNPGANGWRTIMAYDCTPSCPRLQFWASPSLTFGGVPMGVPNQSDDARVLRERAPIVAGFRAPALPPVAANAMRRGND